MNFIRVIIQSIAETAGKIRRFTASGRSGETIEDRELFQHYGFQSRPPAGCEAIAIRQGNGIVIIAEDDRRYHISLSNGEVALSTGSNAKVHLKANNEIHIISAAKVVVDAPAIELGTAALESVLKGEAFMNWFNAHTHTGGFVVPTSPPSAPATALLHLSQKVKAQ